MWWSERRKWIWEVKVGDGKCMWENKNGQRKKESGVIKKWMFQSERGERNVGKETESGKRKVGKHKSKWESVDGMGKVKEGDWNSLTENGKGEVGNWKWETESESKKEINVGCESGKWEEENKYGKEKVKVRRKMYVR